MAKGPRSPRRPRHRRQLLDELVDSAPAYDPHAEHEPRPEPEPEPEPDALGRFRFRVLSPEPQADADADADDEHQRHRELFRQRRKQHKASESLDERIERLTSGLESLVHCLQADKEERTREAAARTQENLRTWARLKAELIEVKACQAEAADLAQVNPSTMDASQRRGWMARYARWVEREPVQAILVTIAVGVALYWAVGKVGEMVADWLNVKRGQEALRASNEQLHSQLIDVEARLKSETIVRPSQELMLGMQEFMTDNADIFRGQAGAPGEKGDKGDPGTSYTAAHEHIEHLKSELLQAASKAATQEVRSNRKRYRGEKGDAGPRGKKGDKGNTGRQGRQGKRGPRGPKGDRGNQAPDTVVTVTTSAQRAPRKSTLIDW